VPVGLGPEKAPGALQAVPGRRGPQGPHSWTGGSRIGTESAAGKDRQSLFSTGIIPTSA
jgi:hypothetical protein